MYLLVLITLFQKMLLIVMLLLTVSDILVFEVEWICWVSTILPKKFTILVNLMTINQEGKMEIRQMIPFFHLFIQLYLYVTPLVNSGLQNT